MLEQFTLQGETVTSLDLKCALVGSGVQYPDEVYRAVEGRARLEPPSNPYACNCLILPGEVASHLQPNPESPFRLGLDESGDVCLYHRDEQICSVTFPAASDYYAQRTSAGNPFGSIAVLAGRGTLAFFYLWPCEYIKAHETCSFCFQVMADMAGYSLPSATHDEVAEIVEWSIENAGVTEIQFTAGTKFATQKETRRYAELLRSLDK